MQLLGKIRLARSTVLIVLLVATIAKVPNISLFIQSSCLPESIRNVSTDYTCS